MAIKPWTSGSSSSGARGSGLYGRILSKRRGSSSTEGTDEDEDAIGVDVGYEADYWKSNAKFWCKFCKIYITDNKVTRKTHDSGTKHKENVERFLRDQNQRSRDKIADDAKLKKEMDAIEKAAQLQYQKDVEAGLIAPPPGGFPPATSSSTTAAIGAATSTSSTSTPTSSSSAAAAASADKDKSTSSSTSSPTASTKTDGSKTSSTAPVTKDESPSRVEKRDETIGQPGQWQTIERRVSGSSKRSRENDGDQEGKKDEQRRGPRLSSSVQGADLDDEEVDPEDLRGFKVVEKTWPGEKPAFDEQQEEGGKGEEETAGSMFKKRKGNVSKTRNIRKKT
ncbi:hypothetical protein DFQ27_005781 [Actinomortierella ambigua]|uniref:Matrin-type domain-containing protein n=1 Tax=Actinomortierella ambigua TaxID=1343610 RepID=A0A9P6U2F9_9FUNG|nr:hypothetical protein DFQ27_005781 [Actinomortierella ambigua]